MKKIVFVGQPHYFRFSYESDLNGLFDVKEFPFHFQMSEEYLRSNFELDADYYFFFRGEFFPESILRDIRGIKIAFSSEPFPRFLNGSWHFTTDSIRRYSEFRSIRNKSFDYLFHYDETSEKLFLADDIHPSGFLQFPVATDFYAKQNVRKDIDIFFIGRSTEHREKLFSVVKNRLKFFHVAHGLYGKELVDILNRSKICVNAHAGNEITWEPRMQMMLSSASFVMSEPILPNKHIIAGKHYVQYDTPQDLYEKCLYYLEHEEEREIVAKEGCSTVRDYFSAKQAYPNLIASIEQGDFKKVFFGKDRFPRFHAFGYPEKRSFAPEISEMIGVSLAKRAENMNIGDLAENVSKDAFLIRNILEQQNAHVENLRNLIHEQRSYMESIDHSIHKQEQIFIHRQEQIEIENETIKNSLVSENESLKIKIQNLNFVLQHMQTSKFWKIRSAYCSVKNSAKLALSSPSFFIEALRQRRRIALVCSTGLVGGAEKVFEQHVRMLSKVYPVDVFFRFQGGPIEENVRQYAKRVFIGEECNEENLSRYGFVFLSQVLPDVVAMKERNPKCRVAFILHDPVLWIQELKRKEPIVSSIDHFFCISQLIKGKLHEAFPNLDRSRSSVLHNSFCFAKENNESFAPSTARKENFVWGYAGRFSFEKNVLEAIMAFSRFQKKYPKSRMIIAGDVSIKSNPKLLEYKEKILDLVQKTDGAEYWGYQSNLQEFYRSIDGLIMTSFIEGISVAALDALSYGIPVLSSDVGSMHEIIEDKKNGVLFEIDDTPENPFDDCKIQFSEQDRNRLLESMEEVWERNWNRKEIADNASSAYSQEAIRENFLKKIKLIRKSR